MVNLAPMTLNVPCVLGGRYEARKRIGSGGMGEVYLAKQLGLDRDVAVKLLSHIPADPGQEERIKERFRREAVALSRLRHPNTVQVIDYGFTDDDRPFIVTELLEGLGLDELLQQEKFLPVDRAIHVLVQVAMSLAEAHHHGIVHRDLKPSNIYLTQAYGKPDFVKVIDFGVARVDGADQADARQRPLTVEGTTLGTPDYMAPEQARGTRPLPATDVYALGCMLYEMLTGAPPFGGESALQIMIAHIREVPRTIRDAHPERAVPAELDDLIGTCLAKNAADRPTDAGALVDRLEAIRITLANRAMSDANRRAAAQEAALTAAQTAAQTAALDPNDDRGRARRDHAEPGSFRRPVGVRKGRPKRYNAAGDEIDYEDSYVGPLPDAAAYAGGDPSVEFTRREVSAPPSVASKPAASVPAPIAPAAATAPAAAATAPAPPSGPSYEGPRQPKVAQNAATTNRAAEIGEDGPDQPTRLDVRPMIFDQGQTPSQPLPVPKLDARGKPDARSAQSPARGQRRELPAQTRDAAPSLRKTQNLAVEARTKWPLYAALVALLLGAALAAWRWL